QIEIEIDEVLKSIEGVRDRCAGKARMDGFDQLEAFGETIGERMTKNWTAASMQDQHARTSALPAHLEIDPLQPVDGRGQIGHRVLLGSTRGESPSRRRRAQFPL